MCGIICDVILCKLVIILVIYYCSFFIAVPHGRPGQRHLYRTSARSSNSTVVAAPVCITCPRGSSLLELRKQGRNPSADHHYAHLQHTKDVQSDGTVLSPGNPNKLSTQAQRSMVISLGGYSASITDMMVLNSSSTLGMGSKSVSVGGQQRGGSSSNINNNPNSTPGSGGGSSAYGQEPKVKKVMVKVSPCLYNSVKFSPNKQFFVRECLGPSVPYVTLHTTPNGQLVYVLNNNTELRDRVSKLALPDMRTFFVETTGGYFAPVRLYLPPGLREEEEFKFPMVLHV